MERDTYIREVQKERDIYFKEKESQIETDMGERRYTYIDMYY